MSAIANKPCGTEAAYQRHLYRKETPCADCRRAHRDYHRQDRAKNPERLNRESAYNAAYARAMARLAKLHPAQFKILLDEEMGR